MGVNSRLQEVLWAELRPKVVEAGRDKLFLQWQSELIGRGTISSLPAPRPVRMLLWSELLRDVGVTLQLLLIDRDRETFLLCSHLSSKDRKSGA